MIYPTRLLILACAALAPLALIVGVIAPQYWFAGLALLVFLLVLAVCDGVLGPLPSQGETSFAVPKAVGVGEKFAATIGLSFARGAPSRAQVAIGEDPLLFAPDGPRKAIALDEGTGSGAIALTTLRRGTARPRALWARWKGPLGLVWKQRIQTIDAPILVTPDIAPVRQAAMQLLHRDAAHGITVQQHIGDGAEFEALADFRAGMDKRAIDWKQSARHNQLLAKEFRTERNNNIVFALDCGRSMCEPLDGLPKIDRAVSAALLCAFVALKDGDRVGLFAFDSHPRTTSKPVSGGRSFPLLQRIAAGIDYSVRETNYTLGMTVLASSLKRRSLVVVFTEFADPISAELMLGAVGPLLKRHLVLFVVLREDELEDFVAAEPQSADDVTRAVTAASLLRQRRLVITRLRHMGVDVIEAAHRDIGPALVARYVDLKRRARL